MQVTETKNEGLKREYQVKLEASLIESKTEERLRSMAGQMKMSGFRPGHVPLKLLKQRFGKEVTGEILEKVINETSGEVVSNNNLRPALPPKIEITSYNEGSDLEYKMELEVLPQLPEFDFEKVALVKPVCEVEPAEIEKAIERFAANSKDYARAEAGAVAKNGDKLTIDFLGRIDGVAFDGGASKGFGLVLGSGSFIAGFEDQLVGSKEGDKITVKVNFPENYHKADLQGKPAEFEVDVHEVLNAAPQEINDELAQKFGFEDLAAIRKAIEAQFSNDYQSYAKNKMKKELFDLLDKEYNFELPQSMVDYEFNTIWQQIEEAKKAGEDLEGKTDEQLREEYRKISERRVKLGLILSEVAVQNKLLITQQELSNAIMQEAKQYPGQEKIIFEYYRKHPQELQRFNGPILEEKSFDFILSKAKLTEQKVSSEELMKQEEDEAQSAKAA